MILAKKLNLLKKPLVLKVNYNYIKVVVLFITVIALFAFSNNRNLDRKISDKQINFLGESKLFLTKANVSKLLIQNLQAATEQTKEIIDLNALESAIRSNPMVKNAEVFVLVSGKLTANVNQKKPIARVNTNTSYYIDETRFVYASIC